MADYVVLMKFTEKGSKNIDRAPQLLDDITEAWGAIPGELTALLVTMGEYDIVAVGSAPDDDAVASFATGLAARGDVKTLTMRAFSRDELAIIIRRKLVHLVPES